MIRHWWDQKQDLSSINNVLYWKTAEDLGVEKNLNIIDNDLFKGNEQAKINLAPTKGGTTSYSLVVFRTNHETWQEGLKHCVWKAPIDHIDDVDNAVIRHRVCLLHIYYTLTTH